MNSSRNRTITIDPQEVSLLESFLRTPDEATSVLASDSIIWGDMMDALPQLPDQFADLILLDPPYNISKTFGSRKFYARSEEQYASYIDSWLPVVCQKLKNNGSLYLCGDWRSSAVLYEALSRHLHIINRITWQREKGRGSNKNWKSSSEDIWFAVKDLSSYRFFPNAVKTLHRVKAPYRENGQPKDWQEDTQGKFRLTYPSNFWNDISVPFWSMPENTTHPTQKPEKLIARLILASSQEGDMIFDPFGGSGTTASVARKLNRRFCTIEQEKEYCLIAAKRLLMTEQSKVIQGYKNGVFLERNDSHS